MLSEIISLFTSFNPVIAGLMLGAGAYIALRHRGEAPVRRAAPPAHKPAGPTRRTGR